MQELDNKIDNITIETQTQKSIDLENEIINLKTQMTNLINILKLKSII